MTLEKHFNDKRKRKIVDIIDDGIEHTANDILIYTYFAIVLSDLFDDEIVMVQKAADNSTLAKIANPLGVCANNLLPVCERCNSIDNKGIKLNQFTAKTTIATGSTPIYSMPTKVFGWITICRRTQLLPQQQAQAKR